MTGASSGIGAAVVRALAQEGARVVAVARSQERLDDLICGCPAGAVVAKLCDLRDAAQVRRLVDEAVSELGRLNILVNGAGVAFQEPVLSVTDEAWQETLAVNLTAPFFVAQQAARHMVAAGGGCIVNVASIDALLADAPFVHYSVSKAGLVMMTKAIAYELGHLNVRCNAVAPGVTVTPMTTAAMDAGDGPSGVLEANLRRIPLRRFSTAEEQAAVVLFLASEESSFGIGETIVADGGQVGGYWYLPQLEPPTSVSQGRYDRAART